jgi:hypothetical protein
MADLDFQNFSTVQSGLQPPPKTVASAATIAPSGFVTVVSGAAAIATITPPVTGAHMLVIIPTGAFTMTATGNINIAMGAATPGQPVLLVYNPLTAKYYAGKLTAA